MRIEAQLPLAANRWSGAVEIVGLRPGARPPPLAFQPFQFQPVRAHVLEDLNCISSTLHPRLLYRQHRRYTASAHHRLPPSRSATSTRVIT